MEEIILNFPAQFKQGIKRAEKIKQEGLFDGVTICGMGGSGLPGMILEMFLQNYKIALPLILHKNYSLPFQTDQKHLLVLMSYSGNTEEVLSSLREGLKKKIKMVSLTSGGKLFEICQKKKIPVVLLPKNLPPRMAIGVQFGALMKILVNSKILDNNLKSISQLEKTLSPQTLKQKGEKIAQFLKNKIPLIYSSSIFRNLSYIWKINLNETAKTFAFSNYIPELNHNEMEGFKNLPFSPSLFRGIFLKDEKDYQSNHKRINLTIQILRKKGIEFKVLTIKRKEFLKEVFSNILLSFWVCYFLGKFYKTDPLNVPTIEKFKQKLK